MATPHPPHPPRSGSRGAGGPRRPDSRHDGRGPRSIESSAGDSRPESRLSMGARPRPDSSIDGADVSRMRSPSEDGSFLNPLQMAGRGSPPFMDDRPGSGFSKVKGTRAVNTPVAPLHVDRRYFPKDMRGLLEIYEQGYTLQEGMKGQVTETTNAMEHLADNCIDTVEVLKHEMQSILLEIQKQAERPANVVWDPVMIELAKIDQLQPKAIGTEVTKRLTEHQEAMLALERRMEEKMTTRIDSIEGAANAHHEGQRNELDGLRQEVTQALSLTAGVGDVVRHIQSELMDLLGKQHRALKADVSESLQDIMRLHEKNRRADLAALETQVEERLSQKLGEHHEGLKTNVESNLEDLKKNQEVQADRIGRLGGFFQAELNNQFHDARRSDQVPHAQIKEVRDIVHDDVSQLFHEIALIQQAMSIDHIVAPKHVSSEASHKGPRHRDFGIQTTKVVMLDKEDQTDDNYFKGLRKRAERRKDLARKTAAARTQADTAPAELKQYYTKKKSGYGADKEKQRKMREALIKPAYSVTQYYYLDGCAQKVARSPYFENLTFCIIALNAMWIAIDTDYNDAVLLVDAPLPFQIAEHAFCAFFTAELTVRFLAFRRKVYCMLDVWFVFDTVLVFGMVLETWVASLIFFLVGATSTGDGDSSYASGVGDVSILRMTRLVKMLRMARMARLLRMMPELVVIVKSIGQAVRSVSFFLLLTVIILYVYAVAFVQFTKDSTLGNQYFSSVPKAMNSLLLDGMLPLYASIIRDVSTESPFYWPLMMTFILLASITLMNMLIGVLVEVVRRVSDSEREAMAVIHVTNELREVMAEFQHSQKPTRDAKKSMVAMGQAFMKRRNSSLHKQGSFTEEFPDMSKETLEAFLMCPSVVSLFRDFGVDACGLLDSIDFIFEEKVQDPGQEGLRFVDLVQVVLAMRGTNPATVKDVKEQMRLMKIHAQEAARSTNTLVMRQIANLRDDMILHLNELRKSIDSDIDEDEEDNMRFISSFTGRGSSAFSGDPFPAGGQARDSNALSPTSQLSFVIPGKFTSTDFGEDDEDEADDSFLLSHRASAHGTGIIEEPLDEPPLL